MSIRRRHQRGGQDRAPCGDTQTPKDSPSITGFITVLIQEKKTLYKKI